MKKITVDLDLLRGLLTSVAPFAAADAPALPVFSAVELRGCGQYLVATATDRYVAAMRRAEAPGVDGFYALIPLTEVKHFLAIFKTTRLGGPATISLLCPEEGRMIASREDGMFRGCFDVSVTYRLIEMPYPDITKLVEEWEPGQQSSTSYNPGLLAKFQAAVERNEPIHLMPGKQGKPTLVMAGDLFGLVMSTTASRDAEPAPDPAAWLAAVRPVKAVGA